MDGISCLCVSNRSEFISWLIWNFDKQSYKGNKELIVVGSKLPVPWREDIIYVGSSGNIPKKRNIALQNAHFNVATWFDDDDWQHPDKLQIIKNKIKTYGYIIGCTDSFFVSIDAVDYYNGDKILFNSIGFPTFDAPKFNEKIYKGSDRDWLKEITDKHSDHITVDELLFFWLSHDKNISNPKRNREGNSSINELKNRVGDYWGETWRHLKKLEAFSKIS